MIRGIYEADVGSFKIVYLNAFITDNIHIRKYAMSKFQETLHTFIDNLPVARSWGWID